jgi:SpoVK/Ycf46/Vps4 family AAA+-type ATPase
LLESLLPTPQSISDELKLAVAVKFGQRPSHIVTLVKRLLDHDSLGDGPEAPRTRSEIERFGREIATASSSTQALRTSVPDVLWTDIGGLASVKQNLLEMVVWPLEKPEVFVRMGISPPLGMLLYGPPGTGKTMLAKAAARASGCNFLNVAASDLMKAEFGESEKAITRVFDTARALSPCVVFIDEFQSLFGNRTTAGVVSETRGS